MTLKEQVKRIICVSDKGGNKRKGKGKCVRQWDDKKHNRGALKGVLCEGKKVSNEWMGENVIGVFGGGRNTYSK